MSNSSEVGPTSLLQMRMQQLFKNSRASSDWSASIPWSLCRQESELVNLQGWSRHELFFDQCGLDRQTRDRIIAADFRSNLAGLLYGEGAAVQILKQVILQTEDPYVQHLCQRQVDEEQKHYDVLLRFFNETGLKVPDISSHLNLAFDVVLRAPNVNFKVIGLQAVLEPLAASFLNSALEAGVSPALEYILKNILADEERHVAFGLLRVKEAHVKENVAVKQPGHQKEIEDFILSVCTKMSRHNDVIVEFLNLEMAERFNEYLLNSPEVGAQSRNAFSRCILVLTQMNLLSANLIHQFKMLRFM